MEAAGEGPRGSDRARMPHRRGVLLVLCFLAAHAATGEAWTDADNRTWRYWISNGGVCLQGCGSPAEGELDIPREINGYRVTEIGELAFAWCTRLTGVTIPEGVTNIMESAFERCPRLARVRLPASLARIGIWAFDGCAALARVEVPPQVAEIGEGAFGSCGEVVLAAGNPAYRAESGFLLTKDGRALLHCWGSGSVEIPESVVRIGDCAFSGRKKVTRLTIPAQVASIGEWVFSGCGEIREIIVEDGNPAYMSRDGLLLTKDGRRLIRGRNGSVAVPRQVALIGNGAFEGYGGLTDVTLAPQVVRIGVDAFRDCRALAQVTIPACVTNIGTDAFRDCPALKTVCTEAGNMKRLKNLLVASCFDVSGLTFVETPGPATASPEPAPGP